MHTGCQMSVPNFLARKAMLLTSMSQSPRSMPSSKPMGSSLPSKRDDVDIRCGPDCPGPGVGTALDPPDTCSEGEVTPPPFEDEDACIGSGGGVGCPEFWDPVVVSWVAHKQQDDEQGWLRWRARDRVLDRALRMQR